MNRIPLTMSIVLAAAIAAHAQTSSTRPATDDAALAAANARIAELEAEVATLRARLDGASVQATQAEVRVATAEARVKTAESRTADAEAHVAPIRDDGNANTLKRIVAEHVKPGMSAADVIATMGEPKEKLANVYVWKRADLGRQVHGTFYPGPKVTFELTFDDAKTLQSIRSFDR